MSHPLCLLQTHCRVASPVRWMRRASEVAQLARRLLRRRSLRRREVLHAWALLTDLLTDGAARGDIGKHGPAPRIHETPGRRHSPSFAITRRHGTHNPKVAGCKSRPSTNETRSQPKSTPHRPLSEKCIQSLREFQLPPQPQPMSEKASVTTSPSTIIPGRTSSRSK